MTEWGVVGVIVVLVGLIASILKPLINLNSSITKLTVAVENLQKDVEGMTAKSSEAHRRLWDHNEEQDHKLEDHEIRIQKVEEKTK